MTEQPKAKCRSCGAEIIWAKTKNGKAMPVDAEPDPKGKIALAETERGLEAFFPTETALMAWEGTRHTSHFATCPNANQHRKK